MHFVKEVFSIPLLRVGYTVFHLTTYSVQEIFTKVRIRVAIPISKKSFSTALESIEN